MLYEIIINYIRLKLLSIIFKRLFINTRKRRSKKHAPIFPYVIELLATYYVKSGKSVVLGNKTIH